ncbi:MAG: hypothetical protein NTW87_28815 [Planctomycetota bacterium]|nr:hypothetical protein [Planctomycetota bacterium]
MPDGSSTYRRWTLCTLVACLAVVLRGTPAAAQATDKGLLAELLRRDLAAVEEIVFAVRGIRPEHWYANFGYAASNPRAHQWGPPGGKLCRMDLRTRAITVLLEDAAGAVRDPCVSYDARTILFSYRKGDSLHYHLFEVNLDGTGLRQLTDGDCDDIEPIYLPDGDLMFCSSRCNRWVNCWFTQVAILYRCDANGGNVREISANIEQDNTPWVLPDGRVLYMRWEYVDRSRVQYHHLWTICPDGTSQMVYYGNMHGGTVMLDAKPIPGTHKVVASFSPGHGRTEHEGSVTIVDPGAGPDERSFARQVSPSGKDEEQAGNDPDIASRWRDPYPLSEDCFLAANRKSLYVMDGRGRYEMLYTVPDGNALVWAHEPRPVVPRPREPLVTSRTDWTQPTGRLVLADVALGRNMRGVKPGEVKKLLVLETLPKPLNFSGTQEPITINGTFTLPRILGTVPVEPDGSAYFEAPALRPLFFVALDEQDLSVKRMQSFVSVMPGETTSCVGCHEQRTRTPGNGRGPLLQALQRLPSRIEPITDVPQVFDFPRDIQPILDRHCVACHNYEKYDGRLALTGDRGPVYSNSYASIFARNLVSEGRDGTGNRPPRDIGSSASRLLKFLDSSHYQVASTAREVKTVRLWIEAGAHYPGTYAALGTGMVRPGGKESEEVLTRRCAKCHVNSTSQERKTWTFGYADDHYFNLSRPEKSLLLLAPLAKESDGLGLCRERTRFEKAPFPDTPTARIFLNKADPDYKALLAWMFAMEADLNRIKRFDMPGFKPNEHYVREMKRYGALPTALDPSKDSLDVYQTDERYWRSFWYRPGPPSR